VLGIRPPQSLLEEGELIYRAISLVVVLIFEFCGPYDISNGNTYKNKWNDPPNERGEGAGGGMGGSSLGQVLKGAIHMTTLTQRG